MSDVTLRELERALNAGDPPAGVRLLAERARAGMVGLDQLRVAAYLGDPDARAITGVAAANATRSKQWIWQLRVCGKAVCVRASVLAVRIVVPAWRELGWTGPVQAHEAAERWLADPSEENRRAASEAVNAAREPGMALAAVNLARAAARSEGDHDRAARLSGRDAAACAYNTMVPLRGRSRDVPSVLGVFERLVPRTVRGLHDVRRVVAEGLREWAISVR